MGGLGGIFRNFKKQKHKIFGNNDCSILKHISFMEIIITFTSFTSLGLGPGLDLFNELFPGPGSGG